MKKSLKSLLLLALVALLAFTVASAFGSDCETIVTNPDGSECLLIGFNGDGNGVYSCEHTNGDTYIGVGACLEEAD